MKFVQTVSTDERHAGQLRNGRLQFRTTPFKRSRFAQNRKGQAVNSAASTSMLLFHKFDTLRHTGSSAPAVTQFAWKGGPGHVSCPQTQYRHILGMNRTRGQHTTAKEKAS